MLDDKPQNIIVNVNQPAQVSWKFWGVVILAIAALVFVTSKILRKKVATRRSKQKIRQNCAKTSKKILVVVHCTKPDAAIKLTKKLFLEAFCPFRVGVVLYLTNVSKSRVNALLRSAARQDEILQSFVDQVHFAQSPHHAYLSQTEAYLHALQANTHAYTFILNEYSTPLQNWDRDICNAHAKLHNKVVLTCVPPEKLTSAVAKNSYMTSNVFKSLQSYLKNSSFNNQNFKDTTRISMFPVLQWNRGPVVVGRLLPRVYTGPLRCTVVSSLYLFGKTQEIREAIEGVPKEVLEMCRRKPRLPCSDFVLSAALYYAGLTTYSICKSTMVVSPSAYKNEAKLSLRVFQNENLTKYLKKFAEYSGVDLTKAVCSGRAQMGLLPDFSQVEVLSKYRSLKQFNEIKESISGIE